MLTTCQIDLLSKGLTFCPTPGQQELSHTRSDLDRFHRSLRLHHFFNPPEEEGTWTLSKSQNTNTQRVFTPSDLSTRDSEGFDNHKFHNKSTWNPKGPSALEAFASCNETQIYSDTKYRRPKDNLTLSERKALKELKSLSHIVIKPADKGSAVVLLNREDYLTEGLRQLSDPKFYREIPVDLSNDHMEAISREVNRMHESKEISQKVKDYLLDFPMRTSRFYMLPKIHKGKNPPPGRPIISGNGCPTERISQLVDHFLKDISPRGKSYLKDTTHFLRTITDLGQLPKGCLLVTLDVTSLYTNIPNREGVEAAKTALYKYRPRAKQPRNSSLIELLKFVLTCNNFTFHGKDYLQG